MISKSGDFERNDGEAPAVPTMLYPYLHNKDSLTDFARGESVLDLTTCDYSAVVDDISLDYGAVFISFGVFVLASSSEDSHGDQVFDIDVIHEGCSDSLRIRLDSDLIDD